MHASPMIVILDSLLLFSGPVYISILGENFNSAHIREMEQLTEERRREISHDRRSYDFWRRVRC